MKRALQIANQRQCSMHPHVIQFREAFCTDNHIGVVMEFLAGSDMRCAGGVGKASLKPLLRCGVSERAIVTAVTRQYIHSERHS